MASTGSVARLTRDEDVSDALGLQHIRQRRALQLVPEGVAEAAARDRGTTKQQAKGDDVARREEAARGSQRTSAGSAEAVSDATTRRDAVRLICVLRWWL